MFAIGSGDGSGLLYGIFRFGNSQVHMNNHADLNANAPDTRTTDAKKVTIVGSIANLALAVVKFAAGVIGGSAAMVADAVHSLSDLVTDVMVYVSVSIASMEADEDHPYGHGRAETIGAAATGAALMLVGLFLIVDAVRDLLEGVLPSPTWPAVAGAIVSIVSKELLYHYTARVGKKHNNKALVANAWHHRTDSISSVAALIGISGAMAGFPVMDTLAVIFVVFLISKVGWDICWQALQELMDASVSPEEVSGIIEVISSNPGVIHFHELRTRRLGGDIFVDAHIQVQPNISVSEAHNIAETVRHSLKVKDLATDALIHIDAENDMDYEIMRTNRAEIESRIENMAKAVDGINGVSKLTIHYLGGKTMVEFNVEMDDDITIGQARSMVSLLRSDLESEKIVDSAVAHAQLTNGPWIPR